MGGGVSLTDVDDKDSKLQCRELLRMFRGVYEAPCIPLLIVGNQTGWRLSVPVAPCIPLLIAGK